MGAQRRGRVWPPLQHGDPVGGLGSVSRSSLQACREVEAQGLTLEKASQGPSRKGSNMRAGMSEPCQSGPWLCIPNHTGHSTGGRSDC